MKLTQKIIILLLLFSKVSAQITVSHPINNAVYQRNSASQANLIISGTYSQPLSTSIQARLLNPTNGTPISGFDWSIIQENPIMGYFHGQFSNVPAGWYTLEIRSVRSGTVLEATTVNRVGIGDVFMIAGQSNAQGYDNNGGVGLGSASEKVVTHNNGMYCQPSAIPFPVMSQILSNTKLSTAGNDAWAYGRLGENILSTTTYPVAFFNSGASSSSTENWKTSSDGLATNYFYDNNQFCSDKTNSPSEALGMPYSNFKRGLNYYNSMFGARSVLWHQGEADALFGTVSAPTYTANLNYVINKSRTDFAANLPWVIARVSYVSSTAHPVISNAQTAMANTSNQIFLGPDTDVYNNQGGCSNCPRDNADLHFTNPTGLVLLADSWSASLHSSFFNTSNPIPANTPPTISVNYNNSTQVTLNVPSGYSSYKWVSGDFAFGNPSFGSSNTLTASSGTYRCWVTTANGNQQISSQINVEQALLLANNNIGVNCDANVYVSDLKFISATNGLGPIEINKTNGSSGDGDGSSIVLKGQGYVKGIGVANNSEIKYNIPSGQYSKFKSFIGISDDVSNSCDNTGGVVFKLYGNETLLYTSPTIYRDSPLQEVDINVFAFTSIKLKVEAVNSNTTCNRAVWADAKLLCSFIDNVPPTVVTNLVATDTLTKCISFQWTHATDDQALGGYYICKNGIIVDTISAEQNSYTLSYLTPSTSVQFGVKAFDLKGNESAIVSKTISTINISFEYVSPYPYICVNRSYFPININPLGGVFSQIEGPSASVNPSTGEFLTSNITVNRGDAYQFFYIQYTVGASIPGCQDDAVRIMGVNAQPTIIPGATADKNLINQGTIVNFTSTACDATSTLNWSFTAPNSTSVQYAPSNTGAYFSYCAKDQCYVYSNNITINVLPNCQSNLVLAPTANNLGSRINSLNFNSSNTINATNTISPTNNVQYNAANTIMLSPGFSVDSGVIFSAKIQNCPN